MKKLLIASLFVFVNLYYGQKIMKFRTTAVSYKARQSNKWTNWSDWFKASVLISVNAADKRIVIYSKETQTFDILGGGLNESGNGGFSCMDRTGKRCMITIFTREQELFIQYGDFEYIYKFYLID